MVGPLVAVVIVGRPRSAELATRHGEQALSPSDGGQGQRQKRESGIVKALKGRSRRSYAYAMEAEERARLEKLDTIVRSDELRAEIDPVVDRVRAALSQQPDALMTWEPIPLEIFGQGLPEEIQSGWIFVLRAGADTGAERHPNSHQRMMTLQGSGDMRVRAGLAVSSIWESNVLASAPSAPLERRWISIPPNVWHRPVVGPDVDWVVISFHTVPAEDLIEEKLDESGAGTKQKKYVEGEEVK
jgi:hypothetical protein